MGSVLLRLFQGCNEDLGQYCILIWSSVFSSKFIQVIGRMQFLGAWKIPLMEKPGRLQSMGSPRVRHNWETSLSLFTFMPWRKKWQPTPVFLPGESQGRGSLVGCCLWGRRVGHDWSDLAAAVFRTEALSLYMLFSPLVAQKVLASSRPAGQHFFCFKYLLSRNILF